MASSIDESPVKLNEAKAQLQTKVDLSLLDQLPSDVPLILDTALKCLFWLVISSFGSVTLLTQSSAWLIVLGHCNGSWLVLLA